MTPQSRILALIFAVGCAALARAEQPSTPAQAQTTPLPVKEEELARTKRIVSDVFPWVKEAKTPQPAKGPGNTQSKPAPSDTGIDMNGEVIIQELGEFSAAPGATPDKQCLTLTDHVVVEQIDNNSVLRAQNFKVIRDLKTGTTELMEAHGNVELFMPGQKGRGEALNYETRYGAHGEIVKDLFTLEGSRAVNKRAYLWIGPDPDPEKNDKFEADKFINDRRLETFRALGNPAAVVTMQPQAGAAAPTPTTKPADPRTAKPAASTGSTGMMPSMGALTSGGVVRLQCDGEMFFEGPSGRLLMTRNAIIQQEAAGPQGPQTVLKLTADESHLIMEVPPPGQNPDNTSMFSGDLKSIECIGRVEMKTTTHVVLCDRCTIDIKQNTIIMEMKNPKDDVRIFIKDDGSGGRALSAKRSFTYNMETQDMQSPFGMKTEALPPVIPTNRPVIKQSAP